MRKIKEVLHLKFEAKLSHERIAAAAGVSKGAVSNYVQRAIQKNLSWPLPDELDVARTRKFRQALRAWISYMITAGILERATATGQPPFVIKGGVALELRLCNRARATKDLDVIRDAVQLQGFVERFWKVNHQPAGLRHLGSGCRWRSRRLFYGSPPPTQTDK